MQGPARPPIREPWLAGRLQPLERIPVALNYLSGVMAGQQPVEDGRECPYVPAIHASLAGGREKEWMPATSAGMTVERSGHALVPVSAWRNGGVPGMTGRRQGGDPAIGVIVGEAARALSR